MKPNNILSYYLSTYNINESYLFDDKTISINLNNFENGLKNKLLIVGVCGSGKTTLAEVLSKNIKF